MQLVSLRVRCRGALPELTIAQAMPPSPARRARAAAPAWFGDGFVETPVYDRYALAPGHHVAGPAIIEEREATTIFAPGDTVTVDATGTLAHRRRGRAACRRAHHARDRRWPRRWR